MIGDFPGDAVGGAHEEGEAADAVLVEFGGGEKSDEFAVDELNVYVPGLEAWSE